jgi:hypothetical protein
MKRILFVCLGVAVLLVFVLSRAAGGDPKDKVAELMQRKLQESQKVLAGIALNDFDKIAKHAEELIEISKTAQWRVLKTPRYEMYSNDFRRTAETLVRHAKDRNLDAATLSYVDLTLTCVKCHKHVREERMTRLDP